MTTTAWLKDRALLLLTGLLAAVASWVLIYGFGEYFVPLMLVTTVVPPIIESFRLRRRMRHFATVPTAFQTASDEFRKLVAAGQEKEAITLFRNAFGLTGIDAVRLIKSLKDPNQGTEKK